MNRLATLVELAPVARARRRGPEDWRLGLPVLVAQDVVLREVTAADAATLKNALLLSSRNMSPSLSSAMSQDLRRPKGKPWAMPAQ